MQDRHGVQWEKTQSNFFMVLGHLPGKKAGGDPLYRTRHFLEVRGPNAQAKPSRDLSGEPICDSFPSP